MEIFKFNCDTEVQWLIFDFSVTFKCVLSDFKTIANYGFHMIVIFSREQFIEDYPKGYDQCYIRRKNDHSEILFTSQTYVYQKM